MWNLYSIKAAAAAFLTFSIASTAFADVKSETISLDSERMLRMHRFSSETFQVKRCNRKFDGTIQANQERYREKFFDELQRLVKELVWVKGEAIELGSEIAYIYEGQSSSPSSKSERLFLEKQFVLTEYNEQNLPTSIQTFVLYDDKTHSKDYLSSENIVYDDKQRVIEERYVAEDGFKERKTYVYTAKTKKPDVNVYENDSLVMSVVNASDTERTETWYFDNEFIIVRTFENNTPKSEVSKKNGQIVRTRNPNEDARFAPKYESKAEEDKTDEEEGLQEEDAPKSKKELREERRKAKRAQKEEKKKAKKGLKGQDENAEPPSEEPQESQ